MSSETELGSLPEFQKPELIGRHSRDVMSRLWLTNFAENLPDLWELPTILDLIPKKERGPAIVIGRGPSLYEKGQLHILEKYQKKFTIFACDGVLCDCLRVGVLPDYVVSVDGNPFLILRYYGDWDFSLHYPNATPYQIKQNTENIILVNEMARHIKCLLNALCHRNLFQRVKQAGFQIYTFQPVWDDPREWGISRVLGIMSASRKNPHGVPLIPTGGNAGATALILTKILKHEVTALIGIDMGYPIDFPLSKTEYYNSMMVKIQGDLKQIPKYFKIYDNPITGSRYYCDTVFNYYRLSLKRIIRDLKIKTVNCSDGTLFPDKGEDIPNLINMDFEEFLKRYD